MPASNSSGTSTTSALGTGSRATASVRQRFTRSPTRGHNTPSSHLRSSGCANTSSATALRSICPPGATGAPKRDTSSSRTSSLASRSWTTASVESVAAPRSSSALSASDFPAPIPPVRPTKGGGPPATCYSAGGAVSSEAGSPSGAASSSAGGASASSAGAASSAGGAASSTGAASASS